MAKFLLVGVNVAFAALNAAMYAAWEYPISLLAVGGSITAAVAIAMMDF